MDSTFKPLLCLKSLTALIVLASLALVLLVPCVRTDSDFKSLAYMQCANQSFTSSSSTESDHSKTLASLFDELSTKSSNSKFSKATVGDESVGISGLFQCRGDLSKDDCHDCVKKLMDVTKKQCKKAVSARIQLKGCYFHYEADGYEAETALKNELLAKSCSGKENSSAPGDSLEVRNAAFEAMEIDHVGFYETKYENVQVMGQCEEDLGPCDCGECISVAVQFAEEECGTSDSGQVYLDKCFVSYDYNKDKKKKEDNKTAKTVAITLGGIAVLVVVFLLLKAIKSGGKGDYV